jgi:hypothetical protein
MTDDEYRAQGRVDFDCSVNKARENIRRVSPKSITAAMYYRVLDDPR